ncbi:hypothetical protein ZYGR_0S02670 [Zygosaccharomyces rouxii]|uniref:ZYRO0F08470p n=2 Tax=Zygosaccharomyces rouxii TaxID=4956 RepID=C5DXX2_ZYGRC|nr:uncharacterized protein ZYRO0F08470g [Zygosaccharomyces rouxii]KAH9199390.1 hypothetical protein LQ764DRAFT_129815 [Zygosaccharomyces rouxii]GAV50133.1 hypothetical protein ZYGR_0S02670 [Zygosaccharomyces rouxii]CAR28633.1 ZYRO0F08470p [Zygosaccharomyces rouxii]
MSPERMPQPEEITKAGASDSEPCLDDKIKNKDRDTDGVKEEVKDSKVQSDDEAAASLGLHRVTERMLSKIKASKDIERKQRNVISKLALNSNGEEDEEEDDEDDDDDDEDGEEEDHGDDENANGGKNDNLEATKKRTLELKASKGTSLKRKRIPPALDLSSCSSGSTTTPNSNLSTAIHRHHTHHGRVESAPPNVSRFPRSTFTGRPIGKPRVQYLGKSRQAPLLPQQQGYKLNTPFVPRIPLPQWQQQYYPYPYAATTAAPAPMLQAYQRPYNYPVPPRSAIPVQMPYYQEYQGYTPYTTTQRKRPQQMTTATTAVNDSEDLRNRESEANQDQNQEQQETEYNQLTVEDDTTVPSTSDELMQGEIRIQRDVFSFEFPGNSPAIDKKMFMSICDKVWDESRETSRV